MDDRFSASVWDWETDIFRMEILDNVSTNPLHTMSAISAKTFVSEFLVQLSLKETSQASDCVGSLSRSRDVKENHIAERFAISPETIHKSKMGGGVG